MAKRSEVGCSFPACSTPKTTAALALRAAGRRTMCSVLSGYDDVEEQTLMDGHIQEHRGSMKLDGFKRNRESKVDWVRNGEVGLGGAGGRVTLTKIQ